MGELKENTEAVVFLDGDGSDYPDYPEEMELLLKPIEKEAYRSI